MRILTIGCGYIGSLLVKHLAEKLPSTEIIISDIDLKAIEKIVLEINRKNVSSFPLDFSDYETLVKTARNFDIVVGLTPGRLGFQSIEAAIEAGVDMINLSYMAENPLTLNKKALRAKISVIPDCGVAPGLSNILVGRAVNLLDKVQNVFILVGGLPQKRIPPLNYTITWCIEDLIEEYVRKARIIQNGKTIEVESLGGVEKIMFPEVGELEAFYTDGIRTLHHTIKGVENMWEKTLRYPGHVEKIKLLKDLGLFEEKHIQGIPLRSIIVNVLEESLRMPAVKDLVAMRICVTGSKNGLDTLHSYHLLDYYDEKKNVTAMGRTTAYTASAIVQLLARKDITEKGVVPPEMLGMNEMLFKQIMVELEQDGIKITKNTNSPLS